MSEVNEILEERGKRYGKFVDHAALSIGLKSVVRAAVMARGVALAPDQLEALDMICHKMARVINGDPDYIDSWDDIAGYATLVANRLRGNSL